MRRFRRNRAVPFLRESTSRTSDPRPDQIVRRAPLSPESPTAVDFEAPAGKECCPASRLSENRRDFSISIDDVVLPHENRRLSTVVAMSNRVQNRLSNCVFVECRNVTREEPFAKLLSRVANVNDRPKFFEEEKQPCPEITPVLIVDTTLGVAPFETRPPPAAAIGRSRPDCRAESSPHSIRVHRRSVLRRTADAKCRVAPAPDCYSCESMQRGTARSLRETNRPALLPELWLAEKSASDSSRIVLI